MSSLISMNGRIFYCVLKQKTLHVKIKNRKIDNKNNVQICKSTCDLRNIMLLKKTMQVLPSSPNKNREYFNIIYSL